MPAFSRISSFLFNTYRTGRSSFVAATAAAAAGGIWRLDLPPKAPPTRRHTTLICKWLGAKAQPRCRQQPAAFAYLPYLAQFIIFNHSMTPIYPVLCLVPVSQQSKGGGRLEERRNNRRSGGRSRAAMQINTWWCGTPSVEATARCTASMDCVAEWMRMPPSSGTANAACVTRCRRPQALEASQLQGPPPRPAAHPHVSSSRAQRAFLKAEGAFLATRIIVAVPPEACP